MRFDISARGRIADEKLGLLYRPLNGETYIMDRWRRDFVLIGPRASVRIRGDDRTCHPVGDRAGVT
jgi:hypothetical protein